MKQAKSFETVGTLGLTQAGIARWLVAGMIRLACYGSSRGSALRGPIFTYDHQASPLILRNADGVTSRSDKVDVRPNQFSILHEPLFIEIL